MRENGLDAISSGFDGDSRATSAFGAVWRNYDGAFSGFPKPADLDGLPGSELERCALEEREARV